MRARVRKFGRLGWGYSCQCGRDSIRIMSWADALGASMQHLADAHGERPLPTPRAQRYRCTVVGCNPELWGDAARDSHADQTGHRTAKWPVRSAEGKRRAKARNRSGYYDRYNVGHKARGGSGYGSGDYGDDSHPFSAEALGQD